MSGPHCSAILTGRFKSGQEISGLPCREGRRWKRVPRHRLCSSRPTSARKRSCSPGKRCSWLPSPAQPRVQRTAFPNYSLAGGGNESKSFSRKAGWIVQPFHSGEEKKKKKRNCRRSKSVMEKERQKKTTFLCVLQTSQDSQTQSTGNTSFND